MRHDTSKWKIYRCFNDPMGMACNDNDEPGSVQKLIDDKAYGEVGYFIGVEYFLGVGIKTTVPIIHAILEVLEYIMKIKEDK